MEALPPPPLHQSTIVAPSDDSIDYSSSTADDSIHAFNKSTNCTVIETNIDSGIEVTDKTDQTPPLNPSSTSSSIISCCSNYDEAYALLVRRNSTLIEDYPNLRTQGDGTSENGSESSSIKSTTRPSIKRTLIGAQSTKKRVSLMETGRKEVRKPPTTPSTRQATSHNGHQSRGRKTMALELNNKGKEVKRAVSLATPGRNTPITPTDDGRWPSVNSKPAPLLSRNTPKCKMTQSLDLSSQKVIEKYATLPRPRKTSARDESVGRTVKKLSQTPVRLTNKNKMAKKVKIYHEIGLQTALTCDDLSRAFAGEAIVAPRPQDTELAHKSVQADFDAKKLQASQKQVENLTKLVEKLQTDNKLLVERAEIETQRGKERKLENDGLREELRINSDRVLAILGDSKSESDSLMVLETRYQSVSQIVIKQEDEISKLNHITRQLQIELEKSQTIGRSMQVEQKEQDVEMAELLEFIQAEKSTLSDALKEMEVEISKYQKMVELKNALLLEQAAEIKSVKAQNEDNWHENLSLQAKLGASEAKSRDLLIHQGASLNGTSLALSALVNRLDGLVDELVDSYSISEQELDDQVYYNEVYSSRSSPECKSVPLSPKKAGSSFISAVINAIRNAASGTELKQDDFRSLNTTASSEMLELETEPCLMMEHVLEDVIIPDGHTHNLISSPNSLINSQTDSLIKSTSTESLSNCSLVDQVIEVDNLVTRLLKVIRIIQMETEDCMGELQEQNSELVEQVDRQKETNRLVGKQLKDWEVLGSRLKSEVKELLQQVSRKNNEIEGIKCELNKQRDEVEKLNCDVCEVSTALAKAEREIRVKGEEVGEVVKQVVISEGEVPSLEVMARLTACQNEIPLLRADLMEKERMLAQLSEEFVASKQILAESLRVAVGEAKKQYEAIDNALEVLHNNENVVQQCSQLAELQRDLETANFESALALPLGIADCNANAALLQARLQINSTA